MSSISPADKAAEILSTQCLATYGSIGEMMELVALWSIGVASAAIVTFIALIQCAKLILWFRKEMQHVKAESNERLKRAKAA